MPKQIKNKKYISGFNHYLKILTETGEKIDVRRVETVIKILEKIAGTEKKLFIAGNGGSSATASHMACDLNKSAGKGKFKAISLSDNIPLLTAIGNDNSYGRIFTDQLEMLAGKGDVLLVISASGNSPNILQVLETAKKMGVMTLAFLGFDGGKAKNMADEYILVPVNHYGVVEDWHLILGHIITEYFKQIPNS